MCGSGGSRGTPRAVGEGMDDVTKAQFQLRVVLVTYRQHVSRNPGDPAAAAAFRERARPLLDSVERAHASEPQVAQLLAQAQSELDGHIG